MKVSRFVGVGLVVLVVILILPTHSHVEQRGPTLAIDLEVSPISDLSSVDSVYSGGSNVVFAFLVVEDMPGGYISGFDLGFEITSSDSSIVNMGFTPSTGWRMADPTTVGFPSATSFPGVRVPAVLGFWELRRTGGASSGGKVVIGPNPLNSSGDVTVVDGVGTLLKAGGVCSAYILSAGTLHPDSVRAARSPCPGALGDYTKSKRRDGENVPGQVMAQFRPGAIELAAGSNSGSVEQINDAGLNRIARSFGVYGVRRLYRNAVRGGREVVSRTGDVVRLTNVWDVYLLEFSERYDPWSFADSLATLPCCVCAEPNGLLRLCSATPNDTFYTYQRGARAIGVQDAWETSTGDTSVRIGILDTGTDYTHPDLGGTIGYGHKIARLSSFLCK